MPREYLETTRTHRRNAPQPRVIAPGHARRRMATPVTRIGRNGVMNAPVPCAYAAFGASWYVMVSTNHPQPCDELFHSNSNCKVPNPVRKQKKAIPNRHHVEPRGGRWSI